MSHMVNNRKRRAIESIFSIACQYSFGQPIISSFDGLYYDGHYHNRYKGKFIKKKCFDRQ